MFLVYAVLGFLNFVLSWTLSSKVELHGHESLVPVMGGDEEPLLSGGENDSEDEIAPLAREKKSLLPRISKESRTVLFKLCILFAVDSLASGLVPA